MWRSSASRSGDRVRACRRRRSPTPTSSSPANAVTEVRLPAALFAGREFVVDAKLDGAAGDRLVRVRVATAPPGRGRRAGTARSSAPPSGAAYKQLLAGHAEFRQVFPLFVCFPQVVPTDEVVTLKMFHREDEPLVRLFLDDEQTRQLDRLWAEHRFISRQPVAENDYLPQFIGFVTQDTPKEFQQFFIDRKPLFKKRADEFVKDEEAAIPKQLDALLDFAATGLPPAARRRRRRPTCSTLYQTIREKGAAHDEAFRGVLARVLVSPAFLFRIEQAPAGQGTRPGQRLGTRHAAELLPLVVAPGRRTAQARRGGPAPRSEGARRAGAADAQGRPRRGRWPIEFGTQWIHVRGFDELKEKNEKLFPTFDAKLRKAIYEESILFFQDLFQSDRPVTQILDADYTFLNETLAKHYGIPGVTGPQWRRVEGVRKYGRGGILGLASVQAKQAGRVADQPGAARQLGGRNAARREAAAAAGRTCRSCPKRKATDKLTMRQLVEKHATRRRVCRLPRAHRPVRLRPGEVRPDRPAAARRTSAACRSMPRRSSRTAPSSRASTACETTC